MRFGLRLDFEIVVAGDLGFVCHVLKLFGKFLGLSFVFLGLFSEFLGFQEQFVLKVGNFNVVFLGFGVFQVHLFSILVILLQGISQHAGRASLGVARTLLKTQSVSSGHR